MDERKSGVDKGVGGVPCRVWRALAVHVQLCTSITARPAKSSAGLPVRNVSLDEFVIASSTLSLQMPLGGFVFTGELPTPLHSSLLETRAH